MSEGSSSEIRLHPLVILSIADHYARRAAQQVRGGSGGRTRVIGALLGVQSGRLVEVQQILEINPNRELAAAHTASELDVCEEDFRCDLELCTKACNHLFADWSRATSLTC
jgi:hypothetical protein